MWIWLIRPISLTASCSGRLGAKDNLVYRVVRKFQHWGIGNILVDDLIEFTTPNSLKASPNSMRRVVARAATMACTQIPTPFRLLHLTDSQFGAKHDFMNGTTVPETVPFGDADRVVKLLKCGWSAIEVCECRDISQDELSAILGISAATLINWTTHSTKLTQIEALLRILERVPASIREQLFGKVLRCFPSIESSQFANMPAVVSRLRSLVKQRTGLTIIQGDESSRTFAFTALGHSILQAKPGPCDVRGIDVHAPDWFVPVPGIAYLPAHASRTRLRDEINSAWPRADCGGRFMLNGILSLVPERQRQLLTLMQTHHVIIADELDWQTPGLFKECREMNVPIHIVEVAAANSRRISIDVRSV